jgi:hypothetical protein
MLDPGVVSCSRCQQPNWVPAGLEPGQLECTHCGVGLLARSGEGRKRKRRPGVLLMSEALSALTVTAGCTLVPFAPQFLASYGSQFLPLLRSAGVTMSAPDAGGMRTAVVRRVEPATNPGPSLPARLPSAPPPPAPPAPERLATISPPPVAVSEGVVRVSKARDRVIPLQIRVATGEHYFIRLVNVADDRDVIDLFIRGGSTLKASMPLGTYRVRFASGQTWYGDKRLFGTQTSYWTAEQRVTFRREKNEPKMVTIELAGRQGGRMKIAPLDPARF